VGVELLRRQVGVGENPQLQHRAAGAALAGSAVSGEGFLRRLDSFMIGLLLLVLARDPK
jgi:hypothetical protein